MKNEYQNKVISKIKKMREEHGLSQKAIAEILGISNGQMGNIESYKSTSKYTIAQIYTICSELKVPIEQVFIEDKDFEKGINIIELLIKNIIKYEERQ